MIVLTVYVSVEESKVNVALAHCREVRRLSVLEPGCERYDFFQSPDDPTRLVFVEEWTSQPHLDAHFEQHSFKSFIESMSDCLAAPPDMRQFEATLTPAN